MKTLRYIFTLLLFPTLSWANDLPAHDVLYQLNEQDNDVFSITFTYLPKEETDPAGVVVTDLSVTGGGALQEPTKIQSGTALHRYTGYTQFFKRTEPKKDMAIQMDLEGRDSLNVIVPAVRSRDIVPVGAIIQSILPWPQYVIAVEDQSNYDPKTSQWAPCDARDIAGSRLQELTSRTNAPDLRGVFLRGLNSFAADEPASVDTDRKDPGGNREAGYSLQGHNVGEHGHTYRGGGSVGVTSAGGGSKRQGLWHDGDHDQVGERRTEKNPTSETRPKNVALYYYIKIN